MALTRAQADANPIEYLGRDIKLTSSYDLAINNQDDFAVVTGLDNVAQAIVDRLKTRIGELTLHPLYGSILPDQLGKPSRADTLTVVRMNVRDALLQEPRIERIVSITTSFEDAARQIIAVEISVITINTFNPLNLIYRVFV